MKTLCGIAAVGLVLLLMAAPAAAARDRDVWDGNVLLEWCREAIQINDEGRRGSPDAIFHAGWCSGRVDGMLDMHAEYTGRSLLRSPVFCLPETGIRVPQGVRIVVRYLETHPERLHLEQRQLIIEAFSAAFPCPAPAR